MQEMGLLPVELISQANLLLDQVVNLPAVLTTNHHVKTLSKEVV